MKLNTLFAAIILTGCVACSAQADVVLDFDTPGDTQGFTDAGGTVVQDTFNGGSLRVTSSDVGATTLSFTQTSAIGMELTAALANGGSISFDAFLLDPTSVAGLVEIQLGIEADFNTQTENLLISNPSAAGDMKSGSFSVEITDTNFFNGTDGLIQYRDSSPSSPRNILLGLRNSGEGTFFIDNFVVSANAAVVPEPSSLLILGSFAGLALIRRKRQIG